MSDSLPPDPSQPEVLLRDLEHVAHYWEQQGLKASNATTAARYFRKKERALKLAEQIRSGR